MSGVALNPRVWCRTPAPPPTPPTTPAWPRPPPPILHQAVAHLLPLQISYLCGFTGTLIHVGRTDQSNPALWKSKPSSAAAVPHTSSCSSHLCPCPRGTMDLHPELCSYQTRGCHVSPGVAKDCRTLWPRADPCRARSCGDEPPPWLYTQIGRSGIRVDTLHAMQLHCCPSPS